MMAVVKGKERPGHTVGIKGGCVDLPWPITTLSLKRRFTIKKSE